MDDLYVWKIISFDSGIKFVPPNFVTTDINVNYWYLSISLKKVFGFGNSITCWLSKKPLPYMFVSTTIYCNGMSLVACNCVWATLSFATFIQSKSFTSTIVVNFDQVTDFVSRDVIEAKKCYCVVGWWLGSMQLSPSFHYHPRSMKIYLPVSRVFPLRFTCVRARATTNTYTSSLCDELLSTCDTIVDRFSSPTHHSHLQLANCSFE
jgi:hypothetical protein